MTVFTIEACLALLGLLILLAESFMPQLTRRSLGLMAMGGTALALVLLTFAGTEQPAFVAPWHQLDGLAFFYKGFSLVITLLVLWLTLECSPYLSRFTMDGKVGELFSLPLIVCAGMMWMASAKDLVTVFIVLELVTVSFYVLVAYARKSALSLEAGVKYLILGALSTGVLVYGIAWIYGATGSMSFEGIATALKLPSTHVGTALFGAALLLAGLGFKVAAAPFHMWVPDVYQGAPTPVTAFLSVGSKAAGFIVLTRVLEAFLTPGSIIGHEVSSLLLVGGSLTVLLGSLPAMFQANVKRLLAYSSISHAGYLLLALACGATARFDLSSSGVVAFYLSTYLPMTVLGFLALGLMRLNGHGEELKDFTGLAKRSPLLALLITLAFASLAGLPLTAGFVGKMFVFLSLVDHGYWGALTCAAIGAAAGFYYYFRIILAMYSSETSEGSTIPAAFAISMPAKGIAIGLAAIIVVLGVYPRPLQRVLSPEPASAIVVK
jgi:NADH-quinone oxidoreductase subunit N